MTNCSYDKLLRFINVALEFIWASRALELKFDNNNNRKKIPGYELRLREICVSGFSARNFLGNFLVTLIPTPH